MKFFGKVFVEFWDGSKWNLSAIPWHKYLKNENKGLTCSSLYAILYIS